MFKKVEVIAYPVPPKDLDLLVGNDDPVEPIDGAN